MKEKPPYGPVVGFRVAVAIATILLLAACGADGPASDGDETPTSEAEVRVDPTTIVVLAGDASQATVTVGDGFDGSVDLSVDGLPATFDASFDPAVVEPGGSSTLTVSAPADAEEGEIAIVLTADDGEASAEAEASVVVEAASVEGAVVNSFGQPLAGLSVSVDGRTSMVTDADGGFSFEGVAVPYDVTVFDASEGWAHRFVGLRTETPRLMPFRFLLGGATGVSSATVTGTLERAVATGEVAYVCVEGESFAVSGCDTLVETEASFDVGAEWLSDESGEVTVRAVVYERAADGTPTRVVASGSTRTTLSPSATPDVGQIDLSTADATSLDVDVLPPAGYDLTNVGAFAHLPGGLGSFRIPDASDPASTRLTFAAPSFVGADYTMFASATTTVDGSQSTGWVTGLEPGADVSLELPAPPALRTPAGGATAGAGSTFAIEGRDGYAHTFYFETSGTGPDVYVSTIEAEATLPDLSSFGTSLTMPASASYDWRVISTSGSTDPDALAAGRGALADYLDLVNAGSGMGDGADEDGLLLVSPTRSFTTP